MDVKNFVDVRLLAFRSRTGMWGSDEAVELQAIQLLEFEARSISEDAVNQNPRLVLGFYVRELSARFEGAGASPLHELAASYNFNFGEILHDVCTSVRSHVAQQLGHQASSLARIERTDDPLRSEVLIDGSWDLDDLSDFPKRYSQVYYFLYLSQHEFATGEPERKTRIFSSYKWRGGYVYATFFRELAQLVPEAHRPGVQSIHYASPGSIRLRLDRSTAATIGHAIDGLLANREELERLQKTASSWNRFCNRMAERDEEPSDDDMRNLYDATAQFAERLGFLNFEQLVRNTGNNVIIASNITLAYYRRLEDLSQYRLDEKAKFL